MARSRDISKVLSSNSTLSNSYLTLASASTSYAPIAAGGLVQIVPGSVSTTGGTATISSSGIVSYTNSSVLNINNCFSSNYDNYKIIFTSVMTIGSNSTTELRMRLRSSSGEDSANNYGGGYSMPYYGNNAINIAAGVQPGTYIPVTQAFYSGGDCSVIFDIARINSSVLREFKGICSGGNGASGAYGIFSGYKGAGTTHTGITFYSNTAGVFTGTMSVYGYKN